MASLVLPLEDEPKALRAAVRQACGRDYRRVNRFIELSLIGAARLKVAGLPPSASLMLGSDTGMWAQTAAVIEGMVSLDRVPKPFEFMNISGSMAGFHVADLLGIRGPQLGLQKNHACFESALPLIQAGPTQHAVVAVVEEGCWPLERMRARLDWPVGALCECSHWMHFDRECEGPIARIETFPPLRSRAEVRQHIAERLPNAHWIAGSAFSRDLSRADDWLSVIEGISRFDGGRQEARHSCGLTMDAMSRFVEGYPGESLIYVNQSGNREFHVLSLDVAPRSKDAQIFFSI